jgi:hypothetical protein
VGKLPVSHRFNRLPLLPSDPGGIQQELVAQDLPGAKVGNFKFPANFRSNKHIFAAKFPKISIFIMVENPVSLWKSSLNYGLFLGIALVLVSLFFYSNDFPAHGIGYGVMIAGVIIAQLQFRKKMGHFLDYNQAVGIGILTMIFASVITGFFSYLQFAVIDPSLQQKLQLTLEEQLVMKGNISASQINLAVSIVTKPAMIFLMSILNGAFLGLIISLLTSIFIWKKALAEYIE